MRDSLALDRYHITVPDDIAARARGAIDRMVALGTVTRRRRRGIAAAALAEDGDRDVTTAVTVPAGLQAEGIIEFRSGGVLAGVAYADAVARGVRVPDRVARAPMAARCAGRRGRRRAARRRSRDILRAERPMLNLLQRASGIATAHPGLRRRRRRARAAASSTPGRPRRAFGRSTSRP